MPFIGLVAVKLLLSAALLPAGARADTVTWAQYEDNFDGTRTLGPLPDYNANDLDLEYCEITEITPGYFDGLPNLKQILLSNNKIEHLDPAVFLAVNGLNNLSIANNRLNEVPNFGKLLLFPNMTKLELNSNQISELDNPITFSSMARLQILSLGYNSIKSLHPDIFKPLNNLKVIGLKSNRISHIPDKMFHIASLKYIYLDNNQIKHIAPGAIRSNELKHLYLSRNKLTHLPQHFVLQLKNASADFNMISLLWNPWQCACIVEVMAEAVSSRVVSFFHPFSCRFPKADQPSCHRPSLQEALETSTERFKSKAIYKRIWSENRLFI